MKHGDERADGWRYCGTCDDWFPPEEWRYHTDQNGDEED